MVWFSPCSFKHFTWLSHHSVFKKRVLFFRFHHSSHSSSFSSTSLHLPPSPSTLVHTSKSSKPVSQWIFYIQYFTPRIIGWTSLLIFLLDTGYSIATIEGRSMQPTLNPDSNLLKRDVVLLEKHVAWTHRWQRGDIVSLNSPSDPFKKCITKRILGLEKDWILMDAHCPFAKKHRLSPGEAIQ
ncbi:hypothetical protein HMI54_004042, partial [Coelomomyces lativittatus]